MFVIFNILFILLVYLLNYYIELARGLEYGVRAPVFYGDLRERRGDNGFPRMPAGNMFSSAEICESLQKPLRNLLGVYGRT